MQAKKRYILVFLSCAFLALCYFGGHRLKQWFLGASFQNSLSPLDCYIESDDVMERRVWNSPKQLREDLRTNTPKERCRMETCFDFSRCDESFKVYVYPVDEESATLSSTYRKILNAVMESRYYTADASQACLFILALDTLDRDSLSADYVRGMQAKLSSLPHWNNGQNHIIFNFYSGTWPDYTEDLGLDIGRAILAKASMSVSNYRPSFDISLPLVHKEHLEKGGDIVPFYSDNMPSSKTFLLAFKGKRYVYGIGSETRNSLYHLHNSRDIIMVTTCKHGKSWKELKDERCEEDNAEYDRYDYEVLLHNSTFCLVPRGRRLGSFRFIEVLQAGCIPVLLSNNWVLPFSEVIDWKSSAVWADERLLLQVPDIVRSIEAERVMSLRQQSQLLWHMYFSSIDRIIFTALEIVRQRIHLHVWKDGRVWNSFPGGLLTLANYSDVPAAYPWKRSPPPSWNQIRNPSPKFTALIYTQQASGLTPGSNGGAPLLRLLRTVARSPHVAKILILWASESPKPPPPRWPSIMQGIPLHIIIPSRRENIGQRFRPLDLIETDAVFSLDEDVTLTTDEINFAFHVWLHFPERIVGFPARTHFWDDTKGSWGYSSKWTNEYSMVLTGAAVYHRYYHSLYTEWASPLLHKTVDQSHNCEDILMNFIVSHVTRQPPIKITQRKQYKSANLSLITRSPWNDPDHFVQRQTCLNTFAAMFGYMPLIRSAVRFDPVLYKDPVSNMRKKYRQMEMAHH